MPAPAQRPRLALAGLVLAGVGSLACTGGSNSVIVVTVSAEPAVPMIFQIRATVSNAGTTDVLLYPQQPAYVSLPNTFGLAFPRGRSGRADIALDGLDAAGVALANGAASTNIIVDGRADVAVLLRPGASLCGNRTIDMGEECDDGNRIGGDGCDVACKREGSAPDGGADSTADTTDAASADSLPDGSDAPVDGAGGDAAPDLPLDKAMPDELPDTAPDVVDDAPVDLPLDGPADPPPGDAADAPAGDGPGADLVSDPPPDLPAADTAPDLPVDPVADPAGGDVLKENGEPCLASGQCKSAFCETGVCCNMACAGPCASCAKPGFEGTCKYEPLGTECAPASCTTSTRSFARTCDGGGVCLPPSSMSCAPYACADDGIYCRTSCTFGLHCSAPNMCRANMTCGTKKIPGDLCGSPIECESGYCVSGYCCSTACAGGTCDSGTCTGGTPPSCTGLPATCGASASESCCTSPLVPGGTFNRSNDMMFPATVSDFRLDKFEITVGRFRKFVEAGMGTSASPPAAGSGANPNAPGTGWDVAWNASLLADASALKAAVKCSATYQTWTDGPGSNEHRPLNCIDWYEAFAFCIWDGGRLATEAEWNYAAAGGTEQRGYPWGSAAPDSAHASYYNGTNCVGDGMPGCAVTDLVFVGTKPAGDGKWGQADLAGNVWEWNFDWYASPYTKPCTDCATTTGASLRVGRGGGFFGVASYLLSSYRSADGPGLRGYNGGARCARTP